MVRDFQERAVYVAGCGCGPGPAVALAFSRAGARVYFAPGCRAVSERAQRDNLAITVGRYVVVFESGNPEAEVAEFAASARSAGSPDDAAQIDIFVWCACSTPPSDMQPGGFERLQEAVGEDSWPFVARLHALRKANGRYPRYAVALAAPLEGNPDGAATLATEVLETLVRYHATHLRPEGVRVNAVRAAGGETSVSPREVAGTVLALCSGLLDAMSGQVLRVGSASPAGMSSWLADPSSEKGASG